MHDFVSHSEPEELDPVAEQILDAALQQFQLLGIRRSSVGDVARRAGVSRVTVYRRFPRKDALIAAMAAREALRVVAMIDAQTSVIEQIGDRIAEGFVLLLAVARDHPLFQQLLAVEPDEVLRYLTLDGGPILAVGTAAVAAQIRRAQRDGEVAEYDPEPVAELVARLAHSLVLTPAGAIPVNDEDSVRAFARAHITPLILSAGGVAAAR